MMMDATLIKRAEILTGLGIFDVCRWQRLENEFWQKVLLVEGIT